MAAVIRFNVLVDGVGLDPAALAWLTRAEVKESDREPSLLVLRFALTRRADGRFFPLDDDLFTPACPVAFEVEPPGGRLTRLFQGYVTHVRPHFEADEANAYLEVLALDAAVLLAATDRAAAWPDATASDVAKDILKGYQIPIRAEPTSARYDKDRTLLIQRGSDWAFLCTLAERSGRRLYFEYDPDEDDVVAHFVAPALTATPQADLVMLQDDRSLAWADVQLVATGPTKRAGLAIDPLDKRLLRGTGEPALPKVGDVDAADAVAKALAVAGAGDASAALDEPFPLDAALTEAATAATDDARFVVELRGGLDPALYRGLLRARRPALVRGIGRRFTGTYYVHTVRTVLDGAALAQTFAAVANATGTTGQESFGRSAEEVPAT